MIAATWRGVLLAAFAAMAIFPAKAQQPPEPEPAAQDTGYLPPARLIAKEEPTQIGLPGEPQSTAPRTPPQKTIGLIVTVGDNFHVKTVGGNEAAKFPIASWKVNDRIASNIANLLRKNFRVKRIAANETAFASLQAPGRIARNSDEDFTGI